jgi:hypothetical protein
VDGLMTRGLFSKSEIDYDSNREGGKAKINTKTIAHG